MKKTVILLILIIMASSASWGASFNENIRLEAQKTFQSLFNRPVAIKSASLFWGYKIVLDDVKITDSVWAKKVYIDFNPLKYAINKGDIVPAITKISIEEGYLGVRRNKAGKIDVLSLLPGGGEDGGGVPFKSKIFINKCSGLYFDESGFGSGPAKLPLNNITGYIDLRNPKNISLDLSAAEFALKGEIKAPKNEANLNIKIFNINLNPLKKLSGEIIWKKNKITFNQLKGQYLPNEGQSEKLDFVASGDLLPLLSLNLDFSGQLYSQNLSGKAKVGLDGSLYSINLVPLKIYKGITEGKVLVDLSKKPISIFADLTAQNLNLSSLSQNLPGIMGELFGKITIQGSIDEFKAAVKADLENASFFEQSLQTCEASISYKNGTYLIDNLNLKSKQLAIIARGELQGNQNFWLEAQASSNRSLIKLSGRGGLRKESALNLSLGGYIELSELEMLKKYGKISGSLNVEEGSIQGTLAKPVTTIKFNTNNINANTICFDRLSAMVELREDVLSFTQPLILAQQKNLYKLQGDIKLGKYPIFNLKCETTDAYLADSLTLANLLQTMFSPKIISQKENLLSSLTYPPSSLPSLYTVNGKKKFQLNYLNHALEEANKGQALFKIEPYKDIDGILSGVIIFKGSANKITGGLNITIQNGRLEKYKFDKLLVKGSYDGSNLSIQELQLEKEGGILLAKGELNSNSSGIIAVAAKRFPADILTLYFKDRNDLSGYFNLSASISGTLNKPIIESDLIAENFGIGKIIYNKILCSLAYQNEVLTVRQFDLINDKEQVGSMYGTYAFNANMPTNITIELSNEALGIMNLLNQEVIWEKMDTNKNSLESLNLSLKGLGPYPNISGKADLKNSFFYIKSLESDLNVLEGNIIIANNILNINKLLGYWSGRKSNWVVNGCSVGGSIGLANFFKDGWVNLNLALADCDWNVNLKELYAGRVEIKNLYLTGPFPILQPISDNSNLVALLNLHDGAVQLPKEGEQNPEFPPVALNLKVNLNKNLYIMGGSVASIDIRNLLINLEAKAEEVLVFGTMNKPLIKGKIDFEQGKVTILNRDLELISTDDQKTYYTLDLEKVKDNIAVFDGKNIMPDLTITARTKVVNLKETTTSLGSSETEKEDIIIVARVKGIPWTTEKERTMSLKLDAFKEDKTKTPPEIIGAGFSEDQVKILLLPDFIKIPLGISNKTNETVNTDAILEDYLNSRVQTLFFRGIERKLEQVLGLESLTLQYNFGKEIKKALTFEDIPAPDTTSTDTGGFGVGFIKGFFDKLYLNVRYFQGIEETGGVPMSNFNYQLTYKLTRFWSIAYYREPASFTDLPSLSSGYYKLTLKGGFQF